MEPYTAAPEPRSAGNFKPEWSKRIGRHTVHVEKLGGPAAVGRAHDGLWSAEVRMGRTVLSGWYGSLGSTYPRTHEEIADLAWKFYNEEVHRNS